MLPKTPTCSSQGLTEGLDLKSLLDQLHSTLLCLTSCLPALSSTCWPSCCPTTCPAVQAPSLRTRHSRSPVSGPFLLQVFPDAHAHLSQATAPWSPHQRGLLTAGFQMVHTHASLPCPSSPPHSRYLLTFFRADHNAICMYVFIHLL